MARHGVLLPIQQKPDEPQKVCETKYTPPFSNLQNQSSALFRCSFANPNRERRLSPN